MNKRNGRQKEDITFKIMLKFMDKYQDQGFMIIRQEIGL